jgi:methylaspartate mutase sigma subunit
MDSDMPTHIQPAHGREVILSSTASDSHTWNLIFLQLLLEEHGYRVANLGACVPDELLLEHCEAAEPDLVVLSSVNGHGYDDGARAVRLLRASPRLRATPIVVGGKLGIGSDEPDRAAALLDAGVDAVFGDDRAGLDAFRALIDRIAADGRAAVLARTSVLV